MSQANVERVIGQLLTDEAFRHRFTDDPQAALQDLAQRGVELNDCEQQALLRMDPLVLSRCAQAIDPRLQKTDLRGGAR